MRLSVQCSVCNTFCVYYLLTFCASCGVMQMVSEVRFLYRCIMSQGEEFVKVYCVSSGRLGQANPLGACTVQHGVACVSRCFRKKIFLFLCSLLLDNSFCVCYTAQTRSAWPVSAPATCVVLWGCGACVQHRGCADFADPSTYCMYFPEMKPGGYFREKNFFKETKHFALHLPPTQTFFQSPYRDFPNKKGLTAFFPIL